MIPASKAGDEFVATAPEDRRSQLQDLRAWVLEKMPEGYEERAGKGLAYVVNHEMFPAGYHCDPEQPLGVAWLTLTKSGFSLHLMTLYWNPAREEKVRAGYKAAGLKLDMGKACIRFSRAEDVGREVLGEIISSITPQMFIAEYQAGMRLAAEMKAARKS